MLRLSYDCSMAWSNCAGRVYMGSFIIIIVIGKGGSGKDMCLGQQADSSPVLRLKSWQSR